MIIEDDLFIDDVDGFVEASLTNEKLLDTQERIGALLDLMPHAIPMGLLVHQSQGILFANKEASRLFCSSPDKMKGQHLFDFMAPSDVTAFMPKFMGAFEHDHFVNIEEISLHVGDQVRIANITIGHLNWDGTSVVQVLIQDITELKAQELELKRLVMTDPLTGAFNRRFFMEHSGRIFEDTAAREQPLTLLLMDIDFFKKINDTYGHGAGDEALKTLVSLWQANTRHMPREDGNVDGQLARMGGEEFAVIFTNHDAEYVLTVAERFRKVLEETSVKYDDFSIRQTASFGLTQMLPSDRNVEDVYLRADKALYQAKETGRNKTVVI